MKYIDNMEKTRFMIFGAGFYGKEIAGLIGKENIECFIDNYQKNDIDGIPVISVKEAKTKNDKYKIIVASVLYYKEMVKQLESEEMSNYIVYGQPHILPVYRIKQELKYMDYREILKRKEIKKYKKVAIYGENAFIHLLINEINFQCNKSAVIGVIGNGEHNEVNYISLEEAIEEADCIVINVHRNNSDIRYELLGKELSCDLLDVFNIDDTVDGFWHKNIEKYKDIHKGERCFLIGNGPSLRVEDLDKLNENGEICFSCNRINLMFKKTTWRPDYYALSDGTAMLVLKEDIKEIDGIKFVADYYESDLKYSVDAENVEYLHYQFGGLINHPGFSFDPARYTCEGGTALYDICMQMAVYMGFSEIYLLGVDNTILTDDNDHFGEEYYSEDYKDYIDGMPQSNEDEDEKYFYNLMNRAFETAKKCSEIKGFKIYNATRGGRLEIFERVEFDNLF